MLFLWKAKGLLIRIFGNYKGDNMQIKGMSDGRFIGMGVIEITAFPSFSKFSEGHDAVLSKNHDAFYQTIREFHRFALNKTMCLEMLWITDKVVNQVVKSRVRVFIIIRDIATSKNAVQNNVTTFTDSVIPLLQSRNYQYIINNYDELTVLLGEVCPESTFSVVKSERISGNMYSPYPYYYCDILPSGNRDNFELLIANLGQTENCCVAFQIFPTRLSRNELSFLNEQVAELARLSKGFFDGKDLIQDLSAIEPQKVLGSYLEKAQGAIFQYNILVFGQRSNCMSLSSRIISLLQAGKEKIISPNCLCMDLSKERISLPTQFLFYPWNINNRMVYAYRNKNAINSYLNIAALKRLPYIMSAEEAVSFFRLPIYDGKMSAIKENLIGITSEQFAEKVTQKDNIVFGNLAANPDIQIGCPERGFTKHMLVVGTPGSGKTTFSINLLLQFANKNIPFLAIEPTKTEYRALIDAVPDLQIFTPGNNGVSPFIINPFIPPIGISVEQYIPGLASAFEAAFSMPSPLDILFLRAIRTCYTQHGWKDYSKYGDPDVVSFGLREFIVTFRSIIRNSQYSAEVKGNLESGGVFRLMNLIEQNSNIYDTIPTIPIQDVLTKPTIIELNSIENQEQKALIIALLLTNICIYTKNVMVGDGTLKNIFLLDEAHVLLSPGSKAGEGEADSQGATVRAIQNMIAEIRSYGTGIIIADQSPTKVSREVVANTDLKVSFRLVQNSEKQMIVDSTGMDDNAESALSKLKVGEAFVYYSALESPQRVITKNIRQDKGIRLSVSNDEIKQRMHYWDSRKKMLRPYRECTGCSNCRDNCDFRLRAQAEYYAEKLYERNSKAIKQKNDVIQYLTYFETMLKNVMEKYSDYDKKRLLDCTKLKFIKKMELEQGMTFTDSEKIKMIGAKQ